MSGICGIIGVVGDISVEVKNANIISRRYRGLGEVIREQITDEGHAVDWVLTIAHADASLRSVDYDLILLDLMLPDGNGLDLLTKIRHSGKTTPVIILTARDQISDRIKGLNAGG